MGSGWRFRTDEELRQTPEYKTTWENGWMEFRIGNALVLLSKEDKVAIRRLRLTQGFIDALGRSGKPWRFERFTQKGDIRPYWIIPNFFIYEENDSAQGGPLTGEARYLFDSLKEKLSLTKEGDSSCMTAAAQSEHTGKWERKETY